ncbi:hypothetical protein BaRGS_00002300 [Batillaria attramentaria]|uniref:Uncharacterized protein n=1 Tax=Batillaria attramentaria TaxID=370345 RepID=A0ABD0M484_9CAEN
MARFRPKPRARPSGGRGSACPNWASTCGKCAARAVSSLTHKMRTCHNPLGSTTSSWTRPLGKEGDYGNHYHPTLCTPFTVRALATFAAGVRVGSADL